MRPPKQYKEDKENETPRLRRDGSAEENVARRNNRRVSFTPPRTRTSLQHDTSQPKREEIIYEEEENSIEIIKQKSEGKLETKSSSILKHSPARPTMKRTDGQSELITSGKMYQPPTQLHDICNTAKTVNDLMEFLRSPHVRGRDLSSSAGRKDYKGRIPMHVLSENHSLAGSIFAPPDHTDFQSLSQMSSFGLDAPNDKQLTKFVVEALLSANVTGVTWRDSDDFIPFERALVDWTRRVYSMGRKEMSKNKSISSFNRRKSGATEAFQTVWATTSMSVSTAFNWAGRSLHFNSSPDDDDEASEMETGTLATAIDPDAPIHFPSSHVRLNSLVRFSIKMLSIILDQIDARTLKGSNRSLQSQRDRSLRSFRETKQELRTDSFDAAMDSFRSFCLDESAEELAEGLVEHIAKIPYLVLTVFLLHDDAEREWVLNTTLFRRVVVHHCSVGPWINFTLQNSDKAVARRGIDYLQYVSSTVESSIAENPGTTVKHDALLEATSQLEGFIPSLLALEERQIEEASTTFIVRSVLDKMISRPFAIAFVFFDFLFLCLLMTGFRKGVNNFLLGSPPGTVIMWIYLANMGIFYFIVREIGKAITIVERTRQASIYLWSFWNITDILSTVLALCSTLAMRLSFSSDVNYSKIDPLRALLAVTTGFLWLRVLSLLKSLNIQLATFVLAILQICKDILWFLMILMVLVAAFSQMFYTLLVPTSCATGETEKSDPQCSQAEYYLRVYSILGDLGDFDEFVRSDFTTIFSVFLVVFFSFLVVIILLNVLIAIVSDSYEKCLVRSHFLFGRARVLLIAELVSFQNLLRTHEDIKKAEMESERTWCRHCFLWNRGWSRGSITFFWISASVNLVWLVGEIAGYTFGERHGNIAFSLLSVFVNVLLLVAIIAFLSRGAARSRDFTAFTSKWFLCIQHIMYRLLGTSQETTLSGETDEWRGRLNYLQKEMERIAEESSACVANQIKCMEHNMAVNENQVQSEMSNLEGGMSELRREIMTELKGIEARNTATMQQVLEAVAGTSSRMSLGSPLKRRAYFKKG